MFGISELIRAAALVPTCFAITPDGSISDRRDQLLRHPQHSVGSACIRVVVAHANHATMTFGSGSQQKRIPNKGAGGDAGLPMTIITCAIINLVAIALFFGLCVFVCL
jgi:hypothetical protein